MTQIDKFTGVIPAFYAAYDENGQVDTERIKKEVEYFIEKGVKGIYVNGSSGECIYLTVPERKAVIEAVMSVAKGKLTVINHVAANSTMESQELAKHAEEQGVDAIASIPPIYFKLPPYSVANYWNSISAAAPNTPFVIYNIPQLAGTALTVPLYQEMLKNPNVIGVKNSSMPIQDIQMFATTGGEDHIVFNGSDEQFIGGRVIGAKAGIGGTYGVMTQLFLKLNELVEANDMATARDLQNAIDEVIYTMVSGRANMYAIIKEILRINEGLDLGSVREPLEPLGEDRPIAEKAAKMIKAAEAKYL
ncbi:MAG: dihydrodipicolinate synthase family protein [Aerococcus sp.]|nr:dihydrodipicolinate synthase family protein [Aerococcus sp.]